jgi:3-carboxy-cis,cis-muconate cycloisomerase
MTDMPGASDIAQLFSQHSIWQSYLDVEAAMALEQGALGMIPMQAAEEIAAKAHLDIITVDALAADIAITRAPIASVARVLSAACTDSAAGFVHWGGTTQNIMQTGRTLLQKKAHAALMARLGRVIEGFCDMAERTAATPAVSRTNHRQALPVTFGFKVAAVIEELERHAERLREAEKRVFTSQMGGAVAAMHAWGDKGPALNEAVSRRLGLAHMHIPARTAADYIAEYALLLALLGTTIDRWVSELYLLMGDEFGELIEDLGEGVIGSSTMPHKVNSKLAVKIIADASRLRSLTGPAFDAMRSTNESDSATIHLISDSQAKPVVLAYEMLCDLEALIPAIRLFPDGMRKNLDLTGGLIAAENVMMTLAPKLGRTHAHDLVHHAAAVAVAEHIPFIEALLQDGEIAGAATREDLERATDAANYTGLSERLTLETVKAARGRTPSS